MSSTVKRNRVRQLACLCLLGSLSLVQALPAAGEWYLGGYGGYSLPQSLKNVTMNNFGYQSAVTRYGFNQTDVILGNTLNQNYKTEDLALKSSPIFGAKGGYFFNDAGLPWLGVELEAFTTKPSIKQQTVASTQDITFALSPNTQPVLPCAAPPSKTCSQYEVLRSTQNISASSLRLVTLGLNVVARYPGTKFQPYVGAGVGAFYFFSDKTAQFDGHQVVPGFTAMAGMKFLATEEWGFFFEGKYNLATITTFDAVYGLSGQYSAINFVGGIAYHF